MVLSQQERHEKLMTLVKASGFTTKEDMLRVAVADSVCLAICIECDHVTDMEPDQDAGYCDECGQNTVQSALVLAGLI